jgi:hypothetical protein
MVTEQLAKLETRTKKKARRDSYVYETITTYDHSTREKDNAARRARRRPAGATQTADAHTSTHGPGRTQRHTRHPTARIRQVNAKRVVPTRRPAAGGVRSPRPRPPRADSSR